MNGTRRRFGPITIVALCVVVGLLLWLKLRLVTGIPRTALAVPESVEPGYEQAQAPETTLP